MDESILNIEQAVEFLGISEKTLFKLLREEHLPARKIGREWRFSKKALSDWLAAGDSTEYIGKTEYFVFSADERGSLQALLQSICQKTLSLEQSRGVGCVLPLPRDIRLPEDATLRVGYKQQRDVEKLEFKLYWPMRDEYKNL